MPRVESKYGSFGYTAPHKWPAEAVRAFNTWTGKRSIVDVFIFDHGTMAAMYLEDALTALSILPITTAEWCTNWDYPVVIMAPRKIDHYSRMLAAAGYRVVVMERNAHGDVHEAGKVVCIASGRESSGRHHKWA